MSQPPPLDLLTRLRAGTRDRHHEVERSPLMGRLIAGRLPAVGFHQLQRNLHVLYAAFEPALARHAALMVRLVPGWPIDGHLGRADRLANDLAHLHGPGWASDLPVLPSTLAGRERIEALDRRGPLLLLAHAYVRYLGDLAGGQILAGRIRQAQGLCDGSGLSFFSFGTTEQAMTLAERLLAALRSTRLDDRQAEALVAEARWSFGLHARMFDELAGAPASQTVEHR